MARPPAQKSATSEWHVVVVVVVVVVAVVVVALTVTTDDDVSDDTDAEDAPNYGGRVCVDTAPGPVPVYRALKSRSIKATPRR